MDRKAILEVKSAKGRQVHAIIATLDQPDADRDIIRPGFFPMVPMESLIVPAHKWDQVPLGKAVTYARGPEVHSILTFNGTQAAASVGTRTTAIKSSRDAQVAHWRVLEARLRRDRWR